MSIIKLVAVWLPTALGVLMIGNGAITFAGPRIVLKNFSQWGYPAGFHRVAGVLGVVIGLLLVFPATSRAGAIGNAIFMAVGIVTLIRSRDRGHLPAAAVFTAASLAAIVIHG